MKPNSGSWNVLGYAGLLIVASLLAQGVAASDAIEIVTLPKSALAGKPMAPVATTEPFFELVSGAGHKYVEVSRYKSADGKFEASVKRYEQVTLHLESWPIDEAMHFISGQVQITDAAGHAKTYGPGDSIVIPKGFVGEWKQLGTLEMVTVTYQQVTPEQR